ncbi:hypothetical protein O181_085523 [Austropuccinia psidii MF-1]|uniref:Uncharacterized protein n=1 Tax=Austropuccinia psidii MF-1 TaxID=1389203 RepID=A0A9Q3FT98_9BASI|nr:hypothetical protein [Austropuccinia psidii MF-1]
MDALDSLHTLFSQILIDNRKRSPKNLIKRIVADVWAIHLGLRLACLLDGVAINEKMAIKISQGIKNILELRNLLVIFEKASESTFIISVEFFKEFNFNSINFIDLSSLPPKILDSCPLAVQKAFLACREACFSQNSEIVIVKFELPSTLISLAGILLNYPVVYCNSSANQIFSGQLIVIQVNLLEVFTNDNKASCFLPQEHRLMSFSFPIEFDKPSSPIESKTLKNKLKNYFQEKLNFNKIHQKWKTVNVNLNQKIYLDRVAL